MDIVWTKHAEERQRQWEEKRGITRNEVEDVVSTPGQVVAGHGDAKVAQKHRGSGLIRVPFVREGSERILLTVYWTSNLLHIVTHGVVQIICGREAGTLSRFSYANFSILKEDVKGLHVQQLAGDVDKYWND